MFYSRSLKIGYVILLCFSILLVFFYMPLYGDKRWIQWPQMQLKRSIPSFSQIQPDARLVDCAAIFSGDKNEIKRAETLMNNNYTNKWRIKDSDYMNLTTNCTHFKKTRGYILNPLSEVELNFPLAYSIVMYRNVEQFERLLRAIYRPQNYYCIHVDNKTSFVIRNSVHSIAGCFDNVHVLAHSYNVEWGLFSLLQPDLACMENLLGYPDWKYFTNMAGEEFPLKTNRQIVEALKALKGANDGEGTPNVPGYKYNGRVRWVRTKSGKRTKQKHVAPPDGINLTKGNMHMMFTRGFVDYLVTSPVASRFLNWTKYTFIPDETFFSTLNHNPQLGIPGSYKGTPIRDPEIKPYISRFINWGFRPYKWHCHGKMKRQVCVFGVGDLPLLCTRYELFLNKFQLLFQPLAYTCMEEFIYNQTYFDTELDNFNITFYENLPQALNHV